MEPKLDLLSIDTHSVYTLGIADISTYPTTFNIVSPTIQITPASLSTVTLPFSAEGINIFNSIHLGLSCDGLVGLPDGIYRFTYSVNPAYKYSIDKTIMRVDNIQERFDQAFMKLDFLQCDTDIREEQRRSLNDIYLIIQASVAAGNRCATKLATDLLNRANKMLTRFNKNYCNG